MADLIQTSPQTPLVFQPSGNPFPSGIGFPSGYIINFKPDLLPVGSGYNSATFDLGVGPRTTLFEWRGKAVVGTGTPIGASVEAYISTSNSVLKDGFLPSGAAGIISNPDKRRNLQFCGSLVCDNTVPGSSLPDPAQAAGLTEIFGRYISLMWWNNLTTPLASGSYFVLTPVPDIIQ